MNNTIHHRWLFWIISLIAVIACTTDGSIKPRGSSSTQAMDWQTYEQVRRRLDENPDHIDYDSLLFIHKTIRDAEKPVAHIDELLFDLIDKRNTDPRIDQMIVIRAADIIGYSKYPIPRVSLLFDTILRMDLDRLTNWVLVWVADALGRYPIDLPDGRQLADLLEARVKQANKADDPAKERFGQHFLPPPKLKAIIDHISRIEDQGIRQAERNAYYQLIINNRSEKEIETGLEYLLSHSLPGRAEKCVTPLVCLMKNWEEVQTAISGATGP